MYRLMGAALLLFGTGGYSYCICREMEQRLECLYEIKKIYQQFMGLVSYSSAAFPELCRMTAENRKGCFQQLLHTAFLEMEKNTGKPLPEIWRETVDKLFGEFPLKKKDKVHLTDFFSDFGCADKSIQLRSMENRMQLLEVEINETQTHLSEKKKIIMSLGLMAGLLFAIVLF